MNCNTSKHLLFFVRVTLISVPFKFSNVHWTFVFWSYYSTEWHKREEWSIFQVPERKILLSDQNSIFIKLLIEWLFTQVIDILILFFFAKHWIFFRSPIWIMDYLTTTTEHRLVIVEHRQHYCWNDCRQLKHVDQHLVKTMLDCSNSHYRSTDSLNGCSLFFDRLGQWESNHHHTDRNLERLLLLQYHQRMTNWSYKNCDQYDERNYVLVRAQLMDVDSVWNLTTTKYVKTNNSEIYDSKLMLNITRSNS